MSCLHTASPDSAGLQNLISITAGELRRDRGGERGGETRPELASPAVLNNINTGTSFQLISPLYFEVIKKSKVCCSI